jgi:hypothetical protein
VERIIGRPLLRTRIDEPALGGGGAGAIGRGLRADRPAAVPSPTGTRSPLVDVTRRAGEEAAREARALAGRPGQAPSRLRIVRALLADSAASARRERPAVKPRPASADSAGS